MRSYTPQQKARQPQMGAVLGFEQRYSKKLHKIYKTELSAGWRAHETLRNISSHHYAQVE